MLLWEVFGMSLLAGWTCGVIFGGAVEAHEKNKEIAQLKRDVNLAYQEAEKLREVLHLRRISLPSRSVKR